MDMNESLARQIITERVATRAATRRPPHARTAQILRRLAVRAEGRT